MKVGDLIEYHPAKDDPFQQDPQAAIVCRVQDDGKVNLLIIDPNGGTYPKRGVDLPEGTTAKRKKK